MHAQETLAPDHHSVRIGVTVITTLHVLDIGKARQGQGAHFAGSHGKEPLLEGDHLRGGRGSQQRSKVVYMARMYGIYRAYHVIR